MVFKTNVLTRLAASPGLRQSIFVTGGNMAATAISAVSLILISRFLGPAEFGVFSVAFSLAMLLSRITDFGLNMSLQKYVAQSFETDPNKAASIILYVTRVKAIISLILIIIGFTIGPALAAPVFNLDRPSIIRVAIIISTATYFFEYFTVIFQSIHQFGHSVLINVIQAATKLTGVGLFFYAKFTTTLGIFLTYNASPIFALVVGFFLLPKWLDQKAKLKSEVLKTFLSMTKYTSIAIIAAGIGDHIDVLMVQKFLNEYQTGLFAAASRISLLMAVIAFSSGQVLNSRVARYTDTQNLRKYLKKAAAFMFIVLVSIFLVLPFSRLIIFVTAGEQYFDAVPALQYLLASGMVVVATMPLVAVFYAIENPRYFAVSGLIQTVALVGLNWLLIPSFGIEGAAFARLATRLLIFLFSLVFVAHSLKKTHGINLNKALYGAS